MMMDYIERFNEACHDSCVIVLLFFMLYIQNFEGGYYEEAALMAANSPKVTSRITLYGVWIPLLCMYWIRVS